MCKVAPGARCSGHTQTQLANKKSARQKVQDKLDIAVSNANKAAAAGRDASFGKFNKAANGYSARLETLDVEIRHIQRDYDGTPKGKEALQALLEDAQTPSDLYNEAVARINKGGALRSLRNNLLDIHTSDRAAMIRQAVFGLDDGEFSEERVVAA